MVYTYIQEYLSDNDLTVFISVRFAMESTS